MSHCTYNPGDRVQLRWLPIYPGDELPLPWDYIGTVVAGDNEPPDDHYYVRVDGEHCFGVVFVYSCDDLAWPDLGELERIIDGADA